MFSFHLAKIFSISHEDIHFVVSIFGIKMKFSKTFKNKIILIKNGL